MPHTFIPSPRLRGEGAERSEPGEGQRGDNARDLAYVFRTVGP
jgi:hypothetical protein